MTNTPIDIATIIRHAANACRSFAACERSFFQNRNGWTGWENWLTVDIVRRLNSPSAVAFAGYESSKQKFDIFIESSNIAVEIKVTYLDEKEVAAMEAEGSGRITSRLANDAKKLAAALGDNTGLLLLAAVFQNRSLATRYQKVVRNDLISTFHAFPNSKWTSCNASGGSISLLSLASQR